MSISSVLSRASLRRVAARSLGLSARGRRPGAQQVPHYVHVHRPLPPTSYPLLMNAHVHEARLLPRSLAQSHDHRGGSSLRSLEGGIPPSLSLCRSLPLLLFAPPQPRGRKRNGSDGARHEWANGRAGRDEAALLRGKETEGTHDRAPPRAPSSVNIKLHWVRDP